MEVKPYSEVRNKFNKYMDETCDNHEPLIVTRSKKRPVVLMSLEDFNGLQETMYLMSSPRNHAMLLKSIAEIQSGKFEEHDLIERQ